MGFRWPIEIDGFYLLKMAGFSMAMLNNRRVIRTDSDSDLSDSDCHNSES